MSHIINKILGREEETERHSGTVIRTEMGSSSGDKKRTEGDQSSETRTVQRDGVNIKSTVSSDTTSTVSMINQQKINELVTKLGSTHTQIDAYAKKQSQKINEEIQREINEVVARIHREQDELLRKANQNTAQIDTEYRAQLQKMVEEVDAAKAKRIAEVERELNEQQAAILEQARNEIDNLNQKAANLKIGALQQAQAKAAADASAISAQATNLGQSTTLAHGSGTTTIKTEIQAGATTKNVGVSTTNATAGGAAQSTVTASSASVTARTGSTSDDRKK